MRPKPYKTMSRGFALVEICSVPDLVVAALTAMAVTNWRMISSSSPSDETMS